MANWNKVLFGSDFPLILYPKRQEVPDYAPFLEELSRLGLSADESAQFMGGNARRVFGLE